MAEVFQDNGYVTGAFVAHSVIANSGVGLLQGFGNVNGGVVVKEKINFERLMPPLFEFMVDNRQKPMFLWLHFMELHRSRTRGNTHFRYMPWYDAEIRYMDDHLGKIFAQMKSLDIYDHTIIVFTADHGEHLGKPHNLTGHQQSVFEELLHVPLIIRGPGFPSGMRISAMVELLDVMPTLTDRLGIDPATTLQGKSMMPLVEGKANSIREFSFAERYYNRFPTSSPVAYHNLAVAQYPWKIYVKVPCAMTLGREPLKWTLDQEGVIVELFNLEKDPQELTDVSSVPENQPILSQLKKALSDFRDQQEKLAALGGSILDDPSQEVQSLLESLGYVGRK
jgi:arylsulfatase A-like enzyme